MINKSKTVGLVLCGGKSSRMGQDKGLIPTNGSNWAGKLIHLLKQAGLEQVYLSVSAQNVDHYREHFEQDKLIVDQIFTNIPSALVGLLSAYQTLKSNPSELNIFVLACDLQKLDISIIQTVMDNAKQFPKSPIHLLSDGEFWQPLAGLYSDSALQRLVEQSKSTAFENKSMMKFIKGLKPNVLLLSEENRHKLANFNSPADLE